MVHDFIKGRLLSCFSPYLQDDESIERRATDVSAVSPPGGAGVFWAGVVWGGMCHGCFIWLLSGRGVGDEMMKAFGEPRNKACEAIGQGREKGRGYVE